MIEAVRFVLATYCSSPHPSLDWRTPAEVLHGRQPKSLMSLFLPCVNDKSDNDCKEKRSSKFLLVIWFLLVIMPLVLNGLTHL